MLVLLLAWLRSALADALTQLWAVRSYNALFSMVATGSWHERTSGSRRVACPSCGGRGCGLCLEVGSVDERLLYTTEAAS